MNIYTTNSVDGSPVVLLDAPITDGSIYHRSLSGESYLQLSFLLPERIDLRKGCFVLYRPDELTGDDRAQFRFELFSNVYPEYRANDGGWKYTVKFESIQSQMKSFNVFYRGQGYDEVSFTTTTTLGAYADLMADCMNRANGGKTWRGVVSLPDSMDPKDRELKSTMRRVLAFKGDKVWDAASRIAEEFGVEWWTQENASQVDICFGKMEWGQEVAIREGEIINRLPARKGDDASYGTRFYIFGSTRNLDKSYLEPDTPDPKTT